MTRFQLFLLTLGLLLILYGLAGRTWLVGRGGGPDGTGRTEASEGADAKAGPGSGSLGFGGLNSTRRSTGDPNQSPGPKRPVTEPPETGPVPLRVHLLNERDGLPCAGASAELYFSQTGEGAAFRSARRVSHQGKAIADDEGWVTLSAPLGRSIEIIAQSEAEAPFERLALGVLGGAPEAPITVRLHTPPRPLEVRVTDESARPIPGVSIRIVEDRARPGAEYTAGGILGSRTAGDGRTTLSGKARSARWLLLDAPGYSPVAIGLNRLSEEENIDVALPGDTSLELTVINDRGQALVGATVEVEFTLAGLSTVRSAATNRQGRVSIGHLPPDTPLRPVITPVGGLPQTVETLESPEGEPLRATLHVVQ